MSYLLKRTLLAILLTLVPAAVFGQAISGDLVGAVTKVDPIVKTIFRLR